jgi:hypothetical protein
MSTKTKYIDSLFCSANNFDFNNYKIDPSKIYCLNIVNDYFENSSKLINLPKNIIKIHIDSKYYDLDIFDSHIHILSIIMLNNLIIVPSTIKKLYLSDKYLDSYPNILHFLQYGIETIELKMYASTEINLNYLPDSISKIVIVITYYDSSDINKNTKIILDKLYPKLKEIKIYDMCPYRKEIRINNIDDIKSVFPCLEIIN